MAKLHTYKGKDITVTWDGARCIHAAECIMKLREVFDPREKPWVQPDNSRPELVANVILDCPTGALKYASDNVKAELPDGINTVMIRPHGPLYVRGDLKVMLPDGEQAETRAALCRCGHSQNRPYCDNSHFEAKFRDRGQLAENEQATAKLEISDALVIELLPNGPIKLRGPHDIVSSDRAVTSRMESKLCRCGQSQNKPFCDGSHKQGFISE
ncbi:MAG: CDGSH iron-sulfur domain-containing protein [bacterium]|nr:CDGSH iron-sulfur domain-containing protein [bacterium]